jgi:pimeloyl-ACP methyl ester carboxylesterase
VTQLIEHKKFLKVENGQVEVAYDYLFDPDTPAQELLILLTGYGRTKKDFGVFRNKLHLSKPNLITASIDLRGNGETRLASEEDIRLDLMALDVVAVATALKAEFGLTSYDLLGISMGGMVSQLVASQDPTLEKLILVSTTAGGALRTFPPLFQAHETFEERENVPNVLNHYVSSHFLDTHTPLMERMQKGFSKEREVLNTGFLKKQFMEIKSFSAEPFLKYLKSKTLIISGDDDRIMPLENSLTLKKFIASSELLVYKDAGHLLLLEKPQALIQDVLDFLNTPSL